MSTSRTRQITGGVLSLCCGEVPISLELHDLLQKPSQVPGITALLVLLDLLINPNLYGSALSGNARRRSGITTLLWSDKPRTLKLCYLNRLLLLRLLLNVLLPSLRQLKTSLLLPALARRRDCRIDTLKGIYALEVCQVLLLPKNQPQINPGLCSLLLAKCSG